MAKKSKLKTPEWIIEGYSSEKEYIENKKIKGKNNLPNKKEKTFKIRVCPKCESKDVEVVLGLEGEKGKGEWKCKNCGWKGIDIIEKEFTENELMKYLDEKGEEVN